MKKSLTLVTFALCNLALFAQGTLIDSLECADVKFYVANNGSFFRRPLTTSGYGGYVVPKHGLISAIGNMSIIAVGEDPNGQMHGAYGEANSSDFIAGPIASDYQFPGYENYAIQLWEVTKSEIDYHIAHWSDPNYVPSTNLLDWPGTGNMVNGTSQMLAPFFDYDGNGYYNPTLGDFPLIRGDRAIYSIINDEGGYHFSGLDPLGIEVHLMFYSFDSEEEVLSRTVFMNTKVINHSATSYTNFHLGFDLNFDLGDFSNDFVGTNPNLSMAYAYNGMMYDGYFFGNPGYGEYPPAIGFMALDDNLYSHISLDGTAPLGTAQGLINSVHGLHDDGSPYLDNNGNPTTHMYTETGFNGEWNENTVQNPMGERRSVVSFLPEYLDAGGTRCYNSAIVFARSYGPTIFDSPELLFENGAFVKTFYNEQQFGCEQFLGLADTQEAQLTVYPNPVSGNELKIGGFNGENFEIWSSDGKLVLKGRVENETVSISNLSKGYYQVCLKNGNHASFVKQ